MLDNLEALRALHEAGTMTRAATRLRITQSAVSKRIAALQDELGVQLVEPAGRRVALTPAAQELLQRVEPLVAELRHALHSERARSGGTVALGVSESILASWGPAALARAQRALPDVELAINAHRSPVAIERVRAGEYLLALCAGDPGPVPDLHVQHLCDEELVLVPARGRRVRLASADVITIERGAATWRSIEPQLRRLRRDRGIELTVTQTVQSFASVVQLARAGFGHGLAPRGIARALGVRPSALIPTGIHRPITLIARPATLARPAVAALATALQIATTP